MSLVMSSTFLLPCGCTQDPPVATLGVVPNLVVCPEADPVAAGSAYKVSKSGSSHVPCHAACMNAPNFRQ